MIFKNCFLRMEYKHKLNEKVNEVSTLLLSLAIVISFILVWFTT